MDNPEIPDPEEMVRILQETGAPILVIWEYRKAAGLAAPEELKEESRIVDLVNQAISGEISGTQLFLMIDNNAG